MARPRRRRTRRPPSGGSLWPQGDVHEKRESYQAAVRTTGRSGAGLMYLDDDEARTAAEAAVSPPISPRGVADDMLAVPFARCKHRREWARTVRVALRLLDASARSRAVRAHRGRMGRSPWVSASYLERSPCTHHRVSQVPPLPRPALHVYIMPYVLSVWKRSGSSRMW